MRILHTADLHLGQILYNNYRRDDEHLHFFSQLKDWIEAYRPDALIVSGDIFDVPRPTTGVWQTFTKTFVGLHRCFPDMRMVIIAGNHDSPSLLHSHSEIWKEAATMLVGQQPPLLGADGEWEEDYILRLPTGYIIGVPYMGTDRQDVFHHLCAYVEKENAGCLPVVVAGHLTVAGSDFTGHPDQIGNLRSVEANTLGKGFDYMALGHIHRPQTIGHYADQWDGTMDYVSPVVRYSGSPLHVSCDETFPHSVSLVDIEHRGGRVGIRQLVIDQLRHFHTLPEESSEFFTSEKEILKTFKKFAKTHASAYVRFKVDCKVNLSADFNNQVYAICEADGLDLRYNPKIIWGGLPEVDSTSEGREEISVEEIQQMTNPLEFVKNTIDDYVGLDPKEVESAFEEIEEYLRNKE